MINIKMTTAEYDTCTTDMRGGAEVTVGLFRATTTLTFTREEWEAFKSSVEDASDTIA